MERLSGYTLDWTSGSRIVRACEQTRVEAEVAATSADLEHLFSGSTVVEWLKAESYGDKKRADLFERRFLPEFRPTFEA